MDIYYYKTAHEFLKDMWLEKKKANRLFTIRSWSKNLGFKSHGPLQQILAGKRPIPKSYIPKLVKSLQLDKKEAEFLERLIDYSRAKNQEERDYLQTKLQAIYPQRKEIRFTEVENFKFFENPLHGIIRTLTEREDFQNDSKWIQAQLHENYTLKEIDETMERLLDLGLLIQDGKRLLKTSQNIYSKPDISNQAVKLYHQKISSMAAKAVKEQDIKNREFNSMTMNINPQDINKAKERLRHFLKDFMREFETNPGKRANTYQLNLQLFEITKTQEEYKEN